MLVERDAFRYLAEGSYEQKRSQVVVAIRGWLSERSVNSIAQYKLVASFPTHAIVVDEETGSTEQFVLENENGVIKVIDAIKINGPKVYAESDKPEFMQAKLSEAVDSLASGCLSSDKIAMLIMSIDEIDTSGAVIRRLQSLIEGDNLWCKYYSENISTILRETWEVQALIESRNDCTHGIQPVIYRMTDLRRRVESLLQRKSQDFLESIRDSLKEMSYWSEKLLNEKTNPYKHSDILKSLVECQIKIDQIVSYAEATN